MWRKAEGEHGVGEGAGSGRGREGAGGGRGGGGAVGLLRDDVRIQSATSAADHRDSRRLAAMFGAKGGVGLTGTGSEVAWRRRGSLGHSAGAR